MSDVSTGAITKLLYASLSDRQVWSNTETEDVSMDDRLIKLGMSSDFSGFRETENENDKKCNTGN